MEDSPPINLVESMQKCERKSSPSVYFILSKFANVWKRSRHWQNYFHSHATV